MLSTFKSLHESRCITTPDGRLVPTFWKPTALDWKAASICGDEDLVIPEETGVYDSIGRVIALGLACEIEVGDFVNQATRLDLPSDSHLKVALKANIADEARHLQGFQYAATAYPISQKYLAEAEAINQSWVALDIHPIEAAAALEAGVFLASLGFLRLAGGTSLFELAGHIAADEYRHVSINRGVVNQLGLPLVPKFQDLIYETVSWMFQGLKLPADLAGMVVDKDFMVKSSRDLVNKGVAKDLDDLCFCGVHTLPFEISNKKLYDREVA